MIIKEITIFTDKIQDQKNFYTKVLGFDLIDENSTAFSLQCGESRLTFNQSETDHKYHYCFLIPSNKLDEAVNWLSQRLDIIKLDDKNRLTQVFDSWNAESVYFYDGAGNIAEFIVRYDLQNDTTKPFDLPQIISVNEIGMATQNVAQINAALEDQLGTKLWKGDLNRFGTNGDQNGLFLLVNNGIKKNWFPTEVPTEPAPFNAVVEVNHQTYQVVFCTVELSVVKL